MLCATLANFPKSRVPWARTPVRQIPGQVSGKLINCCASARRAQRLGNDQASEKPKKS